MPRVDGFRAGMEPKGETSAVLRYGLLLYAIVLAIPFGIHLLARAFA